MLYRFISLGFVLMLFGCAQINYYAQAVHGGFTLIADAKPIDDWLSDPNTNIRLKNKLEKAKQIRDFATHELSLPDNHTYKSYTDLKRPYALWNIVATPALSMKPMQWCFPIAGCVNYRGYYNKEEADQFATNLQQEGLDVRVIGVPAYSTLGWLNDPILSTFIHYPEPELARLMFHELAHQIAYAPGDSPFNEAFATMVEEVGVEMWLAKYGDNTHRQIHAEQEGRKRSFLVLLMKYRFLLENNYASSANDDAKLQKKRIIFQQLRDEYQILKSSWGGYTGYDKWFSSPLSNAHLASVATYHDFVPGFRALLAQEKSLPRFYDAVRSLTALDQNARHQQLTMLTSQATQLSLQDAGASKNAYMPSMHAR